MGSVVEYRCAACSFSTGHLSIGWGKAGRQKFWGALARCVPCRDLGVVDLSAKHTGDIRCAQCQGLLVLFEGTSVSIPCPWCSASLRHARVDTWS